MDNLNTFLALIKRPNEAMVVKPTSLYGLFSSYEDKRKKRGIRYSLALILTLIVLAGLAGERGPTAIAEWVRLNCVWLCVALGLNRQSLPCANTYRLVCASIDATHLAAVLGDFFAQKGPPALSDKKQEGVKGNKTHLAIDGKTLRGTKSEGGVHGKLHLLSVYDVVSKTVLRQKEVLQRKENEISVVPILLEGIDLSGCLISADAMHTQREFCVKLRSAGAHYLLIAKENQAYLHEDLARLFEGEWLVEWDRETAQTTEKGHGRIEVRQIIVTTAMNEYLGARWNGVAQVFRLERKIKRNGEWNVEVVYGLTSLTKRMAGARKLLKFVRDHWKIENCLHWRRDVTLGEDACGVRQHSVAMVLATLRNVVLKLADRLIAKSTPEIIRQFKVFP